MHVKVVCTTDDPLDNLSDHAKLGDSGFSTEVLPTFRPDGLIDIEKDDFLDYLKRLSEITDIEITDFESLKEAIGVRVDFFHTS